MRILVKKDVVGCFRLPISGEFDSELETVTDELEGVSVKLFMPGERMRLNMSMLSLNPR